MTRNDTLASKRGTQRPCAYESDAPRGDPNTGLSRRIGPSAPGGRIPNHPVRLIRDAPLVCLLRLSRRRWPVWHGISS